MFGTVQRCVEEFLRGHPRRWAVIDRRLSFDVSNCKIDGACYLFFDEQGRTPVLVAKAARSAPGRAVFEIEHENLKMLVAHGMNAERETVPSPLHLRREGQILVTLQSALSGALMKNVPGAELFSPRRVDESVGQVLAWWRRFQGCLGTREVVLDGTEWERHVAAEIHRFHRRFRLRDDERELLERRFGDDAVLRGARLPLMARHGDLCTANVVMLDEGVGVFDWEFPLDRRTPLFDLFYFFASLRFPHDVRGGESSHFESFAAVFWEDSYVGAVMRRCLADAARRFGVAQEMLGDLLVLSTIQAANMKYDGMLVANGLEDLSDEVVDDAAKRARWKTFDRPDRDEPFVCIRDGFLENLGLLARRGVPEL